MLRIIVIFILFFKSGSAVIYSINESEYHKMPPLFGMDKYGECMSELGGTYCVASFDLYSKEPSNLMDFIQDYSAYTQKHFNHSNIHRGICLTKTCRHHLYAINATRDPETTLEGCINESIWNNYRIEAKLSKLEYCKRYDDKVVLDTSDYTVAVVYFIIIMLNAIGSFYDIIFCNKDAKNGNPYLLAFSIRRNWAKLVAPSGSGPDPRLKRLKLFNGFRVLTMVCVILSHTTLCMSFTFMENPHFLEKSYDDPMNQFLYNGSLVTHTFFVMSSFLLAYNLQILAEKTEIKWTQIPKGILLRWFRLTPAYALLIATISTWIRHVGDGPLWNMIVTSEANSCRQYWWAHIFYLNNYMFAHDSCLPHTWYLAADTQLFSLGLTLLVLIQSPECRKIALQVLFLASLVISGGLTFFLNLEGIVTHEPESFRRIYVNDITFNQAFIPGHTNISTYTIGLTGGLLIYNLQKTEKDFSKYRKYRWAYWLIFPLGVALILSGAIFFIDGYTPSAFIRLTYATFQKPLFQSFIMALIIGTFIKLETLYRGILEWRGFTWAGRVSYAAYLIHSTIERAYFGSLTGLVHISPFQVIILLSGTIFLSYLFGAVLWLCVEAPIGAIIRILLASSPMTLSRPEGQAVGMTMHGPNKETSSKKTI